MNWDRMLGQIKFDEGYRREAYDDATGEIVRAPVGELTIGWGTRIQGEGIKMEWAEKMLVDKVRTAVEDCAFIFDGWLEIEDLRQEALVNMAYNLGRGRLMKFELMIEAVNVRDWPHASIEAEDSKWFRQVKERGERIVKVLRDG